MALLTLDAPDFSRYRNINDRILAMGGYLTELYEQLRFVTGHLDGDNLGEEFSRSLATAEELSAAVSGTEDRRREDARALREEILRVADEITSASASAVELLDSSLRQWVRTSYTANSDTAALAETLRSEMSQTAAALTVTFEEELEAVQDDVTRIDSLTAYIRATANGLEIGRSDSPLVTTVTNNSFAININDGGTLLPVMTITQSVIKFSSFSKFQMGRVGFVMEENGSVSLARMGG